MKGLAVVLASSVSKNTYNYFSGKGKDNNMLNSSADRHGDGW